MFIVSYITTYRDGIQDMKDSSAHTNVSAFCLVKPQLANDYFLKRLYSDPDIIKPRIKTLSELGIKFKTNK